MRTKIAALVTALTLSVCLFGCGSNSASLSDSTSEDAQNQTMFDEAPDDQTNSYEGATVQSGSEATNDNAFGGNPEREEEEDLGTSENASME